MIYWAREYTIRGACAGQEASVAAALKGSGNAYGGVQLLWT